MDYTTTPATVWVRTEGAAYRLLAPAPAYARLYRPPGVTRTLPLPEAALAALLPLYQREEAHPFETKKVLPALYPWPQP